MATVRGNNAESKLSLVVCDPFQWNRYLKKSTLWRKAVEIRLINTC